MPPKEHLNSRPFGQGPLAYWRTLLAAEIFKNSQKKQRISSHREEDANVLQVCWRDKSRFAEAALPFLRFRGHYVRLERLFTLQLTRSGHFEALLRARFRLHFWHSTSVFESPLTGWLQA